MKSEGEIKMAISGSETNYPRIVGSNTVVKEDEWNQQAPFGHCPACGLRGVEEIHIAGDEDMCFYCHDPGCLTIMGNRSPARTKWNGTKPQELIPKEITDGWEWNKEYFPGENIDDICPD